MIVKLNLKLPNIKFYTFIKYQGKKKFILQANQSQEKFRHPEQDKY